MKHTHEAPTRSNINIYTHTHTKKNKKKQICKQIFKRNPHPNDSYFENCHMYHTPKYL